MARTTRPATPRLMALKRFIGGAVRGLGMKLLDRAVRSIAMADIAITEGVAAVATPATIACLQQLTLLRAVMLEAAAHRGASDARRPAYMRALLSGRVLYLSECVDDWDDGEGQDDSGSVVPSRRMPGASRIDFELKKPKPGLAAVKLWRKATHLTPKNFQRRICV